MCMSYLKRLLVMVNIYYTGEGNKREGERSRVLYRASFYYDYVFVSLN